MKKLFAMLLASVCALSMAAAASAYSEDGKFDIPMANTAPTIDGVITGDEWDNALTVAMNKDTMKGPNSMAMPAKCPDATFYWMWNYDGLYFFADVKDPTLSSSSHTANAGSYNNGDGVQFCIYPELTASGSNVGDLYFWSLVYTDEGKGEIGEHFVFGTGGSGADVEDAVIASTQDGSNYTIEAFLPCVCWESSNTPITVVEGTTFAMTNVLMDMDEAGTQSLCIDSSWFDANTANKYTLSADKIAGHVDAPETVEEVVDGAVVAPQTFDAGVIAAVFAIVSAAGYAISKKR